jgi:hypothetical protein
VTDRIRSVLLVTALLTVAVAGCASTTAGQSSPTTTAGAPSSAAPGISLPPRPKDLSFSGIDPCKVLTQAQQTQLNINRTRPHNPTPPLNERGCSYFADAQKPNYTFEITPSTKMRIQDFLGQIDTSKSTVFSAAGFPAVQNPVPVGVVPSCLGEVDVAPGQMLFIQMALDTPQGLTMDEMCAKLQQSAALAVTTLQQGNG